MFSVLDRDHHMSLKLASVLDEIGVNEHTVQKRRRAMLLSETLISVSDSSPYYFFGSQSEGSTTIDMNSDIDTLTSKNEHNIIQDYSEWEPGFKNLLAIQDKNTSPGYCFLQLLDDNVGRRPLTKITHENQEKYNGKIILKNTLFNKLDNLALQKGEGPSITFRRPSPVQRDMIIALPYKTNPPFLKSWLQKQLGKGKISLKIKREIESRPCYVVAVGNKKSHFRDVEWRISTSHAERYVMFNLNITQMQCYVMLKMILKTYLQHPSDKALSSYMLKNILLQCIDDQPYIWYPQNLLTVFTICLLKLKDCISHSRCPHFILHENDIMAGKFTTEIKNWLLEKIEILYKLYGYAFLGVNIDNVGYRLLSKMYILNYGSLAVTPYISGSALYYLAANVNISHGLIMQRILKREATFISIILELKQLIIQNKDIEQTSARLLLPLVCTSIGSVYASWDIHQGHTISSLALKWLSLGLNSDVASGRLKMASVYYCVGDFETAEDVLIATERSNVLDKVAAVCGCGTSDYFLTAPEFDNVAEKDNEDIISHVAAFCISFIPNEIHCLPNELQFEESIFLSKERNKSTNSDDWIDLFSVDSLPYLYFLQYKTYQHLKRHGEKQNALRNLAISIDTTRNLGHKELDLNLLGHCMEQENRDDEALRYFLGSLQIRPRNNAAQIHISRLLKKSTFLRV